MSRQTSRMPLLLVHGMGRTPWSMAWLAQSLRRRGFRTFLFGYSATFESFEQILVRLDRYVGKMLPGPWLGVGHSLGGLILRAHATKDCVQSRPQGLVTLGTPHRSSQIARLLRARWVYRLLHGDCGQLLADPTRMEAIGLPQIPTLAVIGTAGPGGPWSPFAEPIHDGVVALSEAHLPGMETLMIPGLHTFLMNHPKTVEATVAFARGFLRPENDATGWDPARPTILDGPGLLDFPGRLGEHKVSAQ